METENSFGGIMKQTILMKLAWLMPKSLAYWCAIRVFVSATNGKYSNEEVPALRCSDALQRWGKP